MILDNSLAYVAVYIVIWVALIAVFLIFIKVSKRWEGKGRLYRLGTNLFTAAISIIFVVMLMEGYFGFFYDETDSFGLLLTSERWFKRHLHFNNFWMRDDKDYALEKKQGIKRIVFLGDSFTVGHGIKDIRKRFTGIIEERLSREGFNSEVYTIAVNGWDSVHEIDYLKELAKNGFEADTVVLCFTTNDIAWASDDTYKKFRYIEDITPKSWLLRHSFFLNFLYARIKIFSLKEVKDYYGWLSDAYGGKTWEAEESLLLELKEMCAEKGWRLDIVILPLINDLSNDYKMKNAHDKITSFCRRNGISYIDLAGRLKDFPAKKLMVNGFDAHPNEFAHKIIADEIWQMR